MSLYFYIINNLTHFRGCLKVYHARCVGKKKSFAGAGKRWICSKKLHIYQWGYMSVSIEIIAHGVLCMHEGWWTITGFMLKNARVMLLTVLSFILFRSKPTCKSMSPFLCLYQFWGAEWDVGKRQILMQHVYIELKELYRALNSLGCSSLSRTMKLFCSKCWTT